jgi:4-hydroxymandelate oxidase
MAKHKGKKPKDGELLTVHDFEKAARERLSKMAYDYYRSGADGERTLEANERAYDRYVIWYRVLCDVAERDLSTTVLGTPVRSPILVAPTAYHKMAHEDGECGTARAAAERGTIYVASTLATTSLEEVAAATSAPKWFQLYVHKDRGFTQSLVERAEAAGYDAIVLTVDAPFLGRRLRDERNAFELPPGLEMKNLVAQTDGGPQPEAPAPGLAESRSLLGSYVQSRHDASFTWKDVAWLRSLSHLPLVIKGVVRADDAVRSVDAGAAAVVVSNHGGRQLDSAPATLDALPGIAAALDGRAEVYVDGGIRWGTDVLKAVALGARAVLVGRPVLWGLAVDGERGVARVLELLEQELSQAMALAGVRSLREIDRGLVTPRP